MPGDSQSGALTAGVDVGTTSVKVVLVDATGRVTGRSRVPSALTVGPGGRLEHDPVASWWEAPRTALARAVRESGARPAAVAVSAMMPSATAVGAGGMPVGPALLYGDSRAAGVGREVIDPLANPEMARLCAWLAAQPSEARAQGFWPAQAVANASLGGEGLIDLATAFACGPLFNGSAWDEAVCAEAGIDLGQLPRVAVFGERVGEVRGLEDDGDLTPRGGAGAALAAGSVDGLCEQLVSGASDDGDVLIGLGSTLVVWLTAPGWPDDVPGLWRVPHLVAGKSMVGGASNAGGLWVDWARRLFAPGLPRSAAPGPGPAPAAVPVWWPWARGERVPWHDPSLTVSLRGADISQGPEALLRAAYEASAFVVRHIVERAAACGTNPRRFVVSGGGSADPQWLQALADVLGQPVLPSAVPEGAARGAAFLARMALGWEPGMDDARRWADWSEAVEPDQDWSEAADARYRSWTEGLPAEP
jgi:xylulokinase